MTTLRVMRRLCLAMLLLSSALPWLTASADPVKALRSLGETSSSPLLDDGSLESLRDAVGRSLAWLDRQPPSRRLVFGPRVVTPAELGRGLRDFLELLADDPTPDVLAERVLEEFDVLKSVGWTDGSVLVTGYHEPVIEASETASPEYPVPIFAVPDDLIQASLGPESRRFPDVRVNGGVDGRRAGPYWSRADIEGGRLARRGRVLAWARDPVDVFFMEVEGSGTLRLPDGREIRVGHAATNGRPYRSIGRLLIDEGKIDREAMSMPAIRTWLAAHPEERSRVLHHNESYVFFERRAGPPVGSLGVPLTPGRSIATDARLFPPAALAFIRTEGPKPAAEGSVEWEPVSRFVVNQDTGGAIRGPGRVDLFWGRGPDAELAAGLMKQPGELYFLVPKARKPLVGPRVR